MIHFLSLLWFQSKQAEYLKKANLKNSRTKEKDKKKQVEEDKPDDLSGAISYLKKDRLPSSMRPTEPNQNPFSGVWEMMVDIESGKLCFLNKLSGDQVFKKPVGLKLSPQEQELWEEAEKNPGKKFRDPDAPLETKNPTGMGDWIEVKETNEGNEENFEGFGEEYEVDINQIIERQRELAKNSRKLEEDDEGNDEESEESEEEDIRNFIEIEKESGNRKKVHLNEEAEWEEEETKRENKWDEKVIEEIEREREAISEEDEEEKAEEVKKTTELLKQMAKGGMELSLKRKEEKPKGEEFKASGKVEFKKKKRSGIGAIDLLV